MSKRSGSSKMSSSLLADWLSAMMPSPDLQDSSSRESGQHLSVLRCVQQQNAAHLRMPATTAQQAEALPSHSYAAGTRSGRVRLTGVHRLPSLLTSVVT